jgi:hypothetical protein
MRLIIICLSLLLISSFVRAQSSSALINEALDKQVRITFPNKTPLPQILQQITNDTGVRIEPAPDVWSILPWGEQTAIAATIENQTLRQALEAMTRPLGLTFVLRDEYVELQPLAALRRLGRRATLPELAALDELSRTPFGGDGNALSPRQLLAQVDRKLEEAKSQFAVENRAFNGPGDDETKIAVPRNATLLDALELIPQSTTATWYPWGKTLVVQPKVEQIRMLLSKPITLRLDGVDVTQVVPELFQRAGVPFTIEPGALERIPGDARNIKLTLQDAPFQQALEALGGATGLAYTVNDKGVYLWNPSPGGQGAGGREPTFGLLQLDNGMQVIIRDSQIPADLREYVRHKTAQQFERLRQQMKEEGFKPAPATQPKATTKTSAPSAADERL